VFLLKSKVETYKYVIKFSKKAQRTYEEIKTIRTNNGSEFNNFEFKKILGREYLLDESYH
jgi:hypothetical protein